MRRVKQLDTYWQKHYDTVMDKVDARIKELADLAGIEDARIVMISHPHANFLSAARKKSFSVELSATSSQTQANKDKLDLLALKIAQGRAKSEEPMRNPPFINEAGKLEFNNTDDFITCLNGLEPNASKHIPLVGEEKYQQKMR